MRQFDFIYQINKIKDTLDRDIEKNINNSVHNVLAFYLLRDRWHVNQHLMMKTRHIAKHG